MGSKDFFWCFRGILTGERGPYFSGNSVGLLGREPWSLRKVTICAEIELPTQPTLPFVLRSYQSFHQTHLALYSNNRHVSIVEMGDVVRVE